MLTSKQKRLLKEFHEAALMRDTAIDEMAAQTDELDPDDLSEAREYWEILEENSE